MAQGRLPVSGERVQEMVVRPRSMEMGCAERSRTRLLDRHQAGASILFCGSQHTLCSHLRPRTACPPMSKELWCPEPCRPRQHKMACGESGLLQSRSSTSARRCSRASSVPSSVPCPAPSLPALIQSDYVKEDLPWQPEQRSGLGE